MAEDTSVEFADSYLSGARETANMLTPHTVTAWTRLVDSPQALNVIRTMGFTLIRPLPFGHPDRRGR